MPKLDISRSVVALILALTGCDQASNGSAGVRQAAEPGDVSLACPQIVAGINQQNMLIKQATAQAQMDGQTRMLSNPATQTPDLGNATSGSAALVPGGQGQTDAQREADRVGAGAVARANALVALGRQKKCFR